MIDIERINSQLSVSREKVITFVNLGGRDGRPPEHSVHNTGWPLVHIEKDNCMFGVKPTLLTMCFYPDTFLVVIAKLRKYLITEIALR